MIWVWIAVLLVLAGAGVIFGLALCRAADAPHEPTDDDDEWARPHGNVTVLDGTATGRSRRPTSGAPDSPQDPQRARGRTS